MMWQFVLLKYVYLLLLNDVNKISNGLNGMYVLQELVFYVYVIVFYINFRVMKMFCIKMSTGVYTLFSVAAHQVLQLFTTTTPPLNDVQFSFYQSLLVFFSYFYFVADIFFLFCARRKNKIIIIITDELLESREKKYIERHRDFFKKNSNCWKAFFWSRNFIRLGCH